MSNQSRNRSKVKESNKKDKNPELKECLKLILKLFQT
jgi:hypothetical protein